MDDAVEHLVRQAQQGDARAFSALIARYERSVLAVAYSAAGDGDRAADAAQEAFLRAWRKLETLKEPQCFGNWLLGIARNVALDAGRKLRRQATEPLVDQTVATSADPLQQMDQREQSDRIAAAIQQLDEVSRSAVVLRYYESLSSREIGQLIGLSPAAVDMRLMRARQQLRQFLGDDQPPTDDNNAGSIGVRML
ncbi:MAG TPA: sigma-70 family RNA polymerase sigma factor [Tepidisphaeraceae bacterium]|nr:sigma-70 family RNA polymerase sigma factor [Tepidisphaeraceae bacterium]